ncbi:MAG: hypothetical protein AB8C84_03490 [Oligoflexales bacterium]
MSPVFILFFIVYAMLGLVFSCWISDEFNETRLYLMAFIGVPFATLYLGLCGYRPGWWGLWPRVNCLMQMSLLLVFGWGYVLFLNAWTGKNHSVARNTLVQIEDKDRSFLVHTQRGGLGWLYRYRW